MAKAFYNIKEVAEIFGRNPNTIRVWIRDGRLPVILVQGRYLVSGQVLQSMVNAGARAARPGQCLPGACIVPTNDISAEIDVTGSSGAEFGLNDVDEEDLADVDKEDAGLDNVDDDEAV